MSDDRITITFTADELLDFVEALNKIMPDDRRDEMEELLESAKRIEEATPEVLFFESAQRMRAEAIARQRDADLLVKLRRRLTG